jgi:hypothetical protein
MAVFMRHLTADTDLALMRSFLLAPLPVPALGDRLDAHPGTYSE